MKKSQPLVYFGGTFDPLHNGHTQLAKEACKTLRITKLTLLPCHIPPHKGIPSATSEQRLAMLNLFAQKHPLYAVDGRELRHNQPSYSVITLEQIRAQIHDPLQPVWFFIGEDSLQNLHTWHRWQDILKLTHLIVFPRTQKRDTRFVPARLDKQVNAKLTEDIEQLKTLPCGKIYRLNLPCYDISSSQIRQRIASKQDCSDVLDPDIYHYIKQHNLYQNS